MPAAVALFEPTHPSHRQPRLRRRRPRGRQRVRERPPAQVRVEQGRGHAELREPHPGGEELRAVLHQQRRHVAIQLAAVHVELPRQAVADRVAVQTLREQLPDARPGGVQLEDLVRRQVHEHSGVPEAPADDVVAGCHRHTPPTAVDAAGVGKHTAG